MTLIVTFHAWAAQQGNEKKQPPTPGPMLSQGTIDLDTPEFTLSLVKSSQTVAALRPKTAGDFDFTPGDLLVARSKDGYFHLGDITLRLRAGNSGDWKNYSSAAARNPVRALATSKNELAAADLTPTLAPEVPLQIMRTWALESGKLVLRFTAEEQNDEHDTNRGLGHPDDLQQRAQRAITGGSTREVFFL